VPDFDEFELTESFPVHPSRFMELTDEIRDQLPDVEHRMLGWFGRMMRVPAGHRPLLALEAEQGTAWGEVVNVSFWIAESDLATGDLSRVRRVLEVA
jgi:hypothetical protein